MTYALRSHCELGTAPGMSVGHKPNSAGGGDHTSSAKLRLCYISNPNIIHTRRWIDWFARRGHKVCLLADVPPKGHLPEVQVIDLSQIFRAPVIRFPVWAIWLRQFMRRWKPDVLHAHRVNSAGWLAAACGYHPYVVTPWGSDVFIGPQRSWMERILARYALINADWITPISQAMSELVVQLGARPDRLSRIHFGVEMDVFSPVASSNKERIDLQGVLSLPEGARLVLSARAITPIYNQDIILKSIPLVCQRIPNAIFIFQDYNTNPDYKKQLDEMVISMGLSACIRWLPSTSSRTQMAELYRLCEVVVSVPTTDGTPVSVLEAMACGRPVVCSDLPALREFITQGENGYLVPVQQATPLAEAITRLLEHPEQAAEFGRLANQVVAERANQDVEMQHMESIYYQLASSRSD